MLIGPPLYKALIRPLQGHEVDESIKFSADQCHLSGKNGVLVFYPIQKRRQNAAAHFKIIRKIEDSLLANNLLLSNEIGLSFKQIEDT